MYLSLFTESICGRKKSYVADRCKLSAVSCLQLVDLPEIARNPGNPWRVCCFGPLNRCRGPGSQGWHLPSFLRLSIQQQKFNGWKKFGGTFLRHITCSGSKFCMFCELEIPKTFVFGQSEHNVCNGFIMQQTDTDSSVDRGVYPAVRLR